MAIHTQTLQDASGVDDGPLVKFLHWACEHDDTCYFANHFQLFGGESVIVDFGLLKQELTDHYAEKQDLFSETDPPDIRDWLEERIAAGQYLAWVSY